MRSSSGCRFGEMQQVRQRARIGTECSVDFRELHATLEVLGVETDGAFQVFDRELTITRHQLLLVAVGADLPDHEVGILVGRKAYFAFVGDRLGLVQFTELPEDVRQSRVEIRIRSASNTLAEFLHSFANLLLSESAAETPATDRSSENRSSPSSAIGERLRGIADRKISFNERRPRGRRRVLARLSPEAIELHVIDEVSRKQLSRFISSVFRLATSRSDNRSLQHSYRSGFDVP